VETRDLSILLATLSHLAPAARLRLDRSGGDAPPAPFAPLRHQPGWVHLLNDEHLPHMTDIRVSAFRYEQLRPFHPGRLHRLLETRLGAGDFGAVLRSAGFCRLATRTGVVGSWDQVGQMISLEPLARDDTSDEPPLTLGQDIGFIGIDLDAAALTTALDGACLTDAEFTAGADAWRRLADPFPAWITAVPAED
jgi:G3E family GTPase